MINKKIISGVEEKNDKNYNKPYYFELETSGENENNNVKLNGVLNEMPSFSVTCKYQDGPLSTILDYLKSFYTSDLINATNTLMGETNFKNLVNSGNLSKRLFSGIDFSSFNLKFKIYNDISFLPVQISNTSEWITNLSKYTAISHENKTTATKLYNQIENAVENLNSQGGEKINIILNLSEKENNNDNNVKENKQKIFKLLSINNSLAKIQKLLKLRNDKDDENYVKIDNLHIEQKSIDNNYCIFLMISNNVSLESQGGTDNHFIPGDDAFVFKCNSFHKNEEDHINEYFPTEFNKSSIYLYMKKANNLFNGDYNSVNNKNKYLIDEEWKKILKIINEKSIDETMEKVYNVLGTIRQKAAQLDTNLLNVYNYKRMNYDLNTAFGANIWYLRIYNWLFERPIPVYIADWNYKKSEEYNVSTEFNITCALDQIPSRYTWYNLLLHEDNEKVDFNKVKF